MLYRLGCIQQPVVVDWQQAPPASLHSRVRSILTTAASAGLACLDLKTTPQAHHQIAAACGELVSLLCGQGLWLGCSFCFLCQEVVVVQHQWHGAAACINCCCQSLLNKAHTVFMIQSAQHDRAVRPTMVDLSGQLFDIWSCTMSAKLDQAICPCMHSKCCAA